MSGTFNLSRIIDSDFRIAALETPSPDAILDVFKRLTLSTGRAIYGWSPENGLYRLGTERIFIPHTRSVSDAIRYVAASRHYGIYVLKDMAEALANPSIQRGLERLLQRDDSIRRLLIMMDEKITIPERLTGQVVRIRHQVPAASTHPAAKAG